MSQTLDTLNTVLTNIQSNKAQVEAQIVASTKAMGNPTPDVQAAIDLLISTYGSNVQVIGQTIGAQLQVEQLKKTSVEIDALIAGLQVVLADEANVEAAEAIVNAGVVASPLPVAAGNSQSSAANDTASAPVAAVVAEAPVAGTEVGASAPVDGTVAP